MSMEYTSYIQKRPSPVCGWEISHKQVSSPPGPFDPNQRILRIQAHKRRGIYLHASCKVVRMSSASKPGASRRLQRGVNSTVGSSFRLITPYYNVNRSTVQIPNPFLGMEAVALLLLIWPAHHAKRTVMRPRPCQKLIKIKLSIM